MSAVNTNLQTSSCYTLLKFHLGISNIICLSRTLNCSQLYFFSLKLLPHLDFSKLANSSIINSTSQAINLKHKLILPSFTIPPISNQTVWNIAPKYILNPSIYLQLAIMISQVIISSYQLAKQLSNQSQHLYFHFP